MGFNSAFKGLNGPTQLHLIGHFYKICAAMYGFVKLKLKKISIYCLTNIE
jgi:hypothetical protein